MFSGFFNFYFSFKLTFLKTFPCFIIKSLLDNFAKKIKLQCIWTTLNVIKNQSIMFFSLLNKIVNETEKLFEPFFEEHNKKKIEDIMTKHIFKVLQNLWKQATLNNLSVSFYANNCYPNEGNIQFYHIKDFILEKYWKTFKPWRFYFYFFNLSEVLTFAGFFIVEIHFNFFPNKSLI